MTAGLTPVLAALADDTRWAVLTRLGEAPASASALAREFPVSRQAIVKHLEILRAAGLVDSEQHGREVVYRALGGALSDIARRLERIANAWEARLASIKRLAEAGHQPRPDPTRLPRRGGVGEQDGLALPAAAELVRQARERGLCRDRPRRTARDQ